jgi:Zn-dependent peptidase ImmA (M78 family)
MPISFLNRMEMFDVVESQAHAFARAFLLPDKTFAADLFSPTLDAFRAIKPKWKVSIQAMIMRAMELRLLSPEQQGRIWPNLNRRGWRKSEPLDETLEPESPRLLRRTVDLLLKTGATTRQNIVMQNAMFAEDIEDLIGLPRGYLGGAGGDDGEQDHDPEIIRFPTAG